MSFICARPPTYSRVGMWTLLQPAWQGGPLALQHHLLAVFATSYISYPRTDDTMAYVNSIARHSSVLPGGGRPATFATGSLSAVRCFFMISRFLANHRCTLAVWTLLLPPRGFVGLEQLLTQPFDRRAGLTCRRVSVTGNSPSSNCIASIPPGSNGGEFYRFVLAGANTDWHRWRLSGPRTPRVRCRSRFR